MATAHHLSVVTNSCVKPPTNPKSGLSFTVNERTQADRSAVWHGRDADFLDGPEDLSEFQASRSVNFDSTNTLMETVIPDLNELSDQDFYQRLVDLRSEHKKTLQLCEHLYNEKLRETGRGEATEKPALPIATVDDDYTMSTQPHHMYTMAPGAMAASQRSVTGTSRDKLRDMAFSKPPSGKPKTSKSTPSRSIASKSRHAQTGKRDSYDEKYWMTMSANSTEVDFSPGDKMRSYGRSASPVGQVNTAGARIDDMWSNFSIDDYAPRSSMRQRSNSFSGTSDKSGDEQGWRHRITVPKPFKMTLREDSKIPTRSQNVEEYEMKREEEMRKEEEECQKKFKAKPVPAHVYMPLFDEIMEEKESRRRYIRQHSQDIILSQQKPFKFTNRENEKKKMKRAQSAPLAREEADVRASHAFKANPFPEHIFGDTVADRLQEDEEYRRIRKQMRAEDLLKASSLPPNMKARGENYIDGRSRQKAQAERAKRAGIHIHHNFKPKVNDDVPDFDDIHRKFHQKMSDLKYSKEATVCKPFNLRTERIPSKKHTVYDDIARDEESLRENRWPFSGSRARPFTKSAEWAFGTSLSSSMDSIPARLTTAATLRQSSSRGKLQRQIDRELAELEKTRRRRLREKELKKVITKKATANDQTTYLRKSTDEKIREHRAAERERMVEYKQELNRMYEKVNSRPLLFEQAIQKNAEQRAERKYNETLKRAGLDDEFVSTRGRLAESGAADYTLSDDEDSYCPPQDSYHSSVPSYSAHSSARSASRHYSEDFDHTEDAGNRAGDDESIHDEVEDLDN